MAETSVQRSDHRRDPAVDARLWTLDEVAEYLRVSPATIRRWTNTGLLSCYRPGGAGSRRVFSPRQVFDFLENSQQGRRA